MATDPRRLRPGELCRLLNSTPLGEVVTPRRLLRHRAQAGLRIGDGTTVDLLRYAAWLVLQRHAPKARPAQQGPPIVDLAEAAAGAAALGSSRQQVKGHGQKLTSRQEGVIAALLTEPTYAAAARQGGVSETTLYRWLRLEEFQRAYRRARRELLDAALARMQAASGQAVETLLAIARQGRKEGDRVRAAVALLDRGWDGLLRDDLLGLEREGQAGQAPMGTAEVVRLLAARLRQVDASTLPTAEKSRLTATLADAVLRAIGVDVLDKRLEALQAVLHGRKEKP